MNIDPQDPTYAQTGSDPIAQEFNETAPPASEYDPRDPQQAHQQRQSASFLQQAQDAGVLERSLSTYCSVQATVFGKPLGEMSESERMVSLGYLYSTASQQLETIGRQRAYIQNLQAQIQATSGA